MATISFGSHVCNCIIVKVSIEGNKRCVDGACVSGPSSQRRHHKHAAARLSGHLQVPCGR